MWQNRVHGPPNRTGREKLSFGRDLGGQLINAFRESCSAAAVDERAKQTFTIDGALGRPLPRLIQRSRDSSGQRTDLTDGFTHVAPGPFQSFRIEMERCQPVWIVDQYKGAIEREEFELHAGRVGHQHVGGIEPRHHVGPTFFDQ